MGLDPKRLGGDEISGGVIAGWVDVELQLVLEQTSKGFQDPASQVFIVLFEEHLLQARNAHDHGDSLFGQAE